MITGLAHVCFTVSDLDEAEAFYRDMLGFAHAFDFLDDRGARNGVYLHVGGRGFLELFTGELAGRAQGQSYRHLCLEVDDIEAAVADLAARGVEVTEVKLGSDNSYQAWLTDPDGNRIELHQYTPDSKQGPWLT
ncbi:MAG: VOC family protein [Planctomycetota bacterium]|jgi:catechol 2,3-dioxygenase-like lactoylglutathione lyase family enzyme